MWFGFNPAVNYCHFSTLSFFAGATSTSPKFDLYLWRNNKNCPQIPSLSVPLDLGDGLVAN